MVPSEAQLAEEADRRELLAEPSLHTTTCTDCGAVVTLEVPPQATTTPTAVAGGPATIDCSELFPLPTIFDVCLCAIGSTDSSFSTQREVAFIESTLEAARIILREACQPAKQAPALDAGGGGNEDDDAYDDYAKSCRLDIDLNAATTAAVAKPTVYIPGAPQEAAPIPTADLLSVLASRHARDMGFADFLIYCGFDRYGTRLSFYRAAAHRAPSQRLLIGIERITEELECIHQTGKPNAAVPVLDRVGPLLTQFSASLRKLQDARSYPVFADVVQWAELRNGFYLCMMCAESDETQYDTWADYFDQCRDALQDVVGRVQSYHHCFKLSGSNSSASTSVASMRISLKHSFILSKLLPEKTDAWTPSKKHVMPRSPESKSVHLGPAYYDNTPVKEITQRAGDFGTPLSTSASPGSIASLGDCLTRTPPSQRDRELFRMQLPTSMEGFFRDPESDPVGLFNTRQCCFLNAVIQLCATIPSFNDTILRIPTELLGKLKKGGGDASLMTLSSAEMCAVKAVSRLQTLLGFMKLSQSSAVNPNPLLEAVALCRPELGDGQQHDPHEFLDTLISAVHLSFDVFDKIEEAHNQLQHVKHFNGTGGNGANNATKGNATPPQQQQECTGKENVTAASNPRNVLKSDGSLAAIAPEACGAASSAPRRRKLFTASMVEYSCTAPFALLPTATAASDGHMLPAMPLDNAVTSTFNAIIPLCIVDLPPKTTTREPCFPDYKLTAFHASLEDFLHTIVDNSPPQGNTPSSPVEEELGYEQKSSYVSLKVFDAAPTSVMFYVASRANSFKKDTRPFDFPVTFPAAVLLQSTKELRARMAQRRCRISFLEDQRKEIVSAFNASFPPPSPASTKEECVKAQPRYAASVAVKTALSHVASAKKLFEDEIAKVDVALGHEQLELSNALKSIFFTHSSDTTTTTDMKSASDAAAPRYHLHGAIVHVGPSHLSGHYISFGRSSTRPNDDDDDDLTQTWLSYDDATVSPATLSAVMSKDVAENVYCLFYVLDAAATTIDTAAKSPLFEGEAVIAGNEDAAAVPEKLKALVDKEDMRRQIRLAQRMSEEC